MINWSISSTVNGELNSFNIENFDCNEIKLIVIKRNSF